MKTPRHKIASYISTTTLSKGITKSFSREIAAYLLEEKRTSELDSLLRDVQLDWAKAGTVEVTATSAFPLSPAVEQDIRKQVEKLYPTAKKVIISPVHDPNVIGGIRLNLPGKQLDLSIETKLNKFKQFSVGGKE
jgi:F0F1-type ATP synthase delta subunit